MVLPSIVDVVLGVIVNVATGLAGGAGTTADLLKSLSTPETTQSIELAVELCTCRTSPAISTIFWLSPTQIKLPPEGTVASRSIKIVTPARVTVTEQVTDRLVTLAQLS
jgi:hypothetical protein